MSKVYERVITYECLDVIYRQGISFGEAGRSLIASEQANLFVPGMINICLATEIFLKSINARKSFLEQETDVEGVAIIVGRDATVKVSPGGRGHILSKLYSDLPDEAKIEITDSAVGQGWDGDVFSALRQYDDVFVEWRYIYEQKDLKCLATSPLFEISNAIRSYCEKHVGSVSNNIATEIFE